MASNFVPMLSSSPPPLDDCPDDDDDDFGNIPFDSSFDSPVATSKHKSYKTGDNGVNNLSLKNDFHSICSYNDSEFSNHLSDLSHKDEIINVHVNKQNTCDEREPPFPNSPTDSNIIKTFNPESIKNSISCDASSALSSADSLDDEETIPSSEPLQLKLCLEDDDESFDSVSTIPAETSINSKLSQGDSNNYQSNPCGLFNNSNYVDCDAKYDEAQNSDISFECFKENNFSSENFEFSLKESSCVTENLEFPVDFDAAEEDDFDEFQQAFSNQAQTTDFNSDIISKESSSQSKTDEEFRTEFNNVHNSGNCDSEYDEDFDDFQGFSKAPSACMENGVSETDLKVLQGDEDFQDFRKCDLVEDEADEFDEFQGCSASENSSTQDFANFESVSFEEKAQSDSPQFANFESASFSSDEIRSNLACASSAQDKSFDKIATVLNAIFPPVSESSDDCDPPTEILEHSNKSHRLWEKLHEVEQAPSLRFQWGVSHSFQQLLRSINVDYHSILRTSSVPIFASSLSLLEPVKGQTKVVNAESEDRRKTQNLNDPIPPVEFDWTSSGLVNPLDSGQAASVLMDLSFLATSDTATSPSNDNHSFENELLKPSPLPACSESLNKTLILEELLSKNVCSLPNSKTAHRPPNISEEANSVLDQLPDLSFMRAKVLMFPISSKT